MNTIQYEQRNRSSKDINTINDNFARETNKRDEDNEMQRYVEEQLAILQQKSSTVTTTSTLPANNELQIVFATLKRPEDTLFHVSKHLITDHSMQASEEMLSDQMLSGIPEVDIGVEYVCFISYFILYFVFFISEKIRNIEETDKAKRKLLQTLCEKKGTEKKMSAVVGQSTAPISLLSNTNVIPSTPSKTASISFVQHKRCKLKSYTMI